MNTATLAPGTPPALAPGEIDLGIVIEDGNLANARRIILLPGEKTSINWRDAGAWAKAQGGDLPTRMEMLLLFKTQRDQFSTADPYWTNEPYAGNGAYAWSQSFYDGYQDYWHKALEFRARAVRRVVI